MSMIYGVQREDDGDGDAASVVRFKSLPEALRWAQRSEFNEAGDFQDITGCEIYRAPDGWHSPQLPPGDALEELAEAIETLERIA